MFKYKILIAFICILLFLPSAFAESQNVYVSVRNAKVKSKPQFISPTNFEAGYGDTLGLLGEEGEWFRVQGKNNKQGFVHSSAVKSKKVVLNSDSSFSPGSKKSQESIVMAGKGFSKVVEKKYAALNSNLNYSAVDRMEKVKISENEISSFISKGNLNTN